jgi:hypothetical protein
MGVTHVLFQELDNIVPAKTARHLRKRVHPGAVLQPRQHWLAAKALDLLIPVPDRVLPFGAVRRVNPNLANPSPKLPEISCPGVESVLYSM